MISGISSLLFTIIYIKYIDNFLRIRLRKFSPEYRKAMKQIKELMEDYH